MMLNITKERNPLAYNLLDGCPISVTLSTDNQEAVLREAMPFVMHTKIGSVEMKYSISSMDDIRSFEKSKGAMLTASLDKASFSILLYSNNYKRIWGEYA